MALASIQFEAGAPSATGGGEAPGTATPPPSAERTRFGSKTTVMRPV